MTCVRCDGFMVVESLFDLKAEGSQLGLFGGRCINCGNLEDWVISQNRVERPSLRHAPRGGAVEKGIIPFR